MEPTGFELKFHSSEYEWSFPATRTLREVIQVIDGYYEKITFQYSTEGLNVLSDGEHIGTLKPAYLTSAKVTELHRLMSIGH